MNTSRKVGRPKKEERFVHKSFKLPRELADELDAFSEKTTEPISLIIRKALIYYIKKHETKLGKDISSIEEFARDSNSAIELVSRMAEIIGAFKDVEDMPNDDINPKTGKRDVKLSDIKVGQFDGIVPAKKSRQKILKQL